MWQEAIFTWLVAIVAFIYSYELINGSAETVAENREMSSAMCDQLSSFYITSG